MTADSRKCHFSNFFKNLYFQLLLSLMIQKFSQRCEAQNDPLFYRHFFHNVSLWEEDFCGCSASHDDVITAWPLQKQLWSLELFLGARLMTGSMSSTTTAFTRYTIYFSYNYNHIYFHQVWYPRLATLTELFLCWPFCPSVFDTKCAACSCTNSLCTNCLETFLSSCWVCYFKDWLLKINDRHIHLIIHS